MCSLICHSGLCSKEKECQEKVSLKCACKTVKKSVPCNLVKNEKDLKEPKKPGAEQKLMLKCNEKCELKLKKNDIKNDIAANDTNVERPKSQNKSYVYFIFGFIIMVISILAYFFLNNV